MAEKRFSIGGMVVRAAVFLALAIPIVLFQADRSSRGNPAFAMNLPQGIGGFADYERARFWIDSDPEMAVASAEDVLRHRPVAARNLSLYAVSQVRSGNMEQAAAALSLASTRGWRDEYVQINTLASFVADANYPAALQRFQALIRARRSDVITAAAGEYILAEDGAAPVMAQALTADAEFARRVIDLGRVNDNFSRMLAGPVEIAERSAHPLACDNLAKYAEIMLRQGNPSIADRAYPDRCDSERDKSLAFTQGDEDNPFRWSYPGDGATSVSVDPEKQVLSTKNRSPARKQVAVRHLRLSAGPQVLIASHEVNKSVMGIGGVADIELRVRCGGRSSNRSLRVEKRGPDEFAFDVPQDCPVQYLGVFVGRGELDGLRLSLR